MSTSYSLTDSLPRDARGQPLMAWVNDQTSQLDFGLPRGIGGSQTGSKILLYLATANATQSSKIESLHPFTSVGGTMIEPATTQASPVVGGRGKIAHVSNWGELRSSPHPRIPATLTTGSKNTVKAGSAIVYSFYVSWSAVSLGETFSLLDDAVFRGAIVATSVAGNDFIPIPDGGWLFSSSVTLQRTLGGACSMVCSYL
jgi:hypothetical protein